MIIHDRPRRFQILERGRQGEALLRPRPTTGTRWDAQLAAVVEHIARLHDHPVSAWVDKSEQFLDTPWVVPTVPSIARDSVFCARGAFIRHGALPDPPDLGPIGGDTHDWIPTD